MILFGASALLFFLGVLQISLAAPPTFVNLADGDQIEVPENAPRGYVIQSLTGSDADGDVIIFLVRDNTNFRIESGSTDVRLEITLDRETTSSYPLTLRALTPGNSEFTDITVTVVVTDINDNLPVLTFTTSDITIPEDTPAGTELTEFNFTTTDPDSDDTISYSLSGLGSETLPFNINRDTGVISLNRVLDLETTRKETYTPTLRVTDGVNDLTQQLTITVTDINDNPPTCSQNTYLATYKENADPPAEPLVTLDCSDDDFTAANNELTYTIAEGDTVNFNVNSSTGEVLLINKLDYETQTKYTLKINVSDPESSVFTATVVVEVLPEDDNDPEYLFDEWTPPFPSVPSTEPHYTVSENSPIGTSVVTISGVDADIGETVVYGIRWIRVTADQTPATGAFNIDPVTGVLSTGQTFDAETQPTMYTIQVTISDPNTRITSDVRIGITGINDITPKFVESPYRFTVVESAAVFGYSVSFTVTDLDTDGLVNPTFAVNQVLAGNTADSDWSFSRDGNVVTLSLQRNLDLDNGDEAYNLLRLTVVDGGTPRPLTGTGTLAIVVTPDNEFTPGSFSFTPAQTVTISEAATIDTTVVTVQAQDNDARDEGTLMYAITAGNTDNAFIINAATGVITVQNTLDRETIASYELVVTATDSGLQPKSASATVTVGVLDVSDNAPICNKTFITAKISELATVDDPVTTLECEDLDSNDTLEYGISDAGSLFKFDPETDSTMKVKALLDYDSGGQSYDIQVSVFDGTNTIVVTVRVSVEPSNEFAPVFPPSLSTSVPENQAVPFEMPSFVATDQDLSHHGVVSYAIENVTNNGENLFRIDSVSGLVTLVSPLDYEALPTEDKSYVVTVAATDGGGLVGYGTITVSVTDVNDNPPTCDKTTYTTSISEDTDNLTLPHEILQLNCRDEESDTNLTYSVFSQSPGNFFDLDNGFVRLVAGGLDFETTKSYEIVGHVSDTSSPSLTTTVTTIVNVLNANDGGPVFSAQNPVNINENVPIGTFVADVTATDPDGDDPDFGDPQYSIVGGDTAGQFSINRATGRIETVKPLDRETTPSYSLEIQAEEKNGDSPPATATVVVDLNAINDESPICDPDTLLADVSESEDVDYEVGTFSCSDPDGDTLTYTINGGSTLFKILGDKLLLQNQLDFETARKHEFSVVVSDGVSSHHVTLVVSINVIGVDEGPPVFNPTNYTVEVNEGDEVGTSIINITATDPDSPVDGNGQITYSFASPNPLFQVNSRTGEISIAKSLDRETADFFELMIVAEDASGSNTATLDVTVTDANDNTPIFSSTVYRAEVDEGEPDNSPVITVTATDADSATNDYGTVKYNLDGSSSFSIDPESGLITTTAVIDADTAENLIFSLKIYAYDSNRSQGFREATAQVLITVATVNQFDPVINAPTSVTIPENETNVGDLLFTVNATDADTGVDGKLDLSSSDFQQDKFELLQYERDGVLFGEFRLKEALDFDQGDVAFEFIVYAKDGGSTSRTATATVTLMVTNVNDNAPFCTSVLVVQVDEGSNLNITLDCSDADAGTTLGFFLENPAVSPSGGISPQVDQTTGEVTTAAPLDFETGFQYSIFVRVQDEGNPILFTTVTIYLYINDVNENDPIFTSLAMFDLDEDTMPSNPAVFQVVANGGDGASDVVTYEINPADEYFEVDADTGKVYLKRNAPDYETQGDSYMFTVCATDSLENPNRRSACQDLNVTINDVNDEGPVFDRPVYTASLAEDAPIGSTLPAVTVTDADGTAAFNTITYEEISDPEGAFSVDSSTGEITTSTALDYETTKELTLVLLATDGVNNATATYIVTVTPVNDNKPVFNVSMVTLEIDEDTPLQTIIDLQGAIPATDADEGIDGSLSYSITSAQCAIQASSNCLRISTNISCNLGPLSIDPYTGVVKLTSVLDSEMTSGYNLRIKAVDGGSPAQTALLTVILNVGDVNEFAPTCTQTTYKGMVVENSPQGLVVETLDCRDRDATSPNNQIAYSLDGSDLFDIDNTGKILLTQTGPDREMNSSYSLTVRVYDGAVNDLKETFITVDITVIDVNDNAPVIVPIPSKTFREDTALGTILFTLDATDEDIGTNGEISFQITGGNVNNMFSIDKQSGAVTLVKNFDFEMADAYTLDIEASDHGIPMQSAQVSVTLNVTDVNDVAPICATAVYTVEVNETSQNDPLITVVCTDQDTVGAITYSISGGNAAGFFSIDSATGELSTASDANLDAETETEYNLVITASDGQLTTTTRVKVIVKDVSEFAPQFSAQSYTNSLPETSTIGTTVKTVVATDGDVTDNTLVYSIAAGNDENKFSIDALSGIVQLRASLDYETTQTYQLTLEASDERGQTGTASLIVSVTDVNDNNPRCTQSVVPLSLEEGKNLTNFYTPSCSDDDGTSTLTYSTTSAIVTIDSGTGELSLVNPLDYETDSEHSVIINVRDEGSAGVVRSTQITVEITVVPVNEFAPVFDILSTIQIAEDAPIGQEVTTVQATDDDQGLLHGTVRYSIVSGDSQQQFSIEETSGVILLVRPLDRETQSSYDLTIRATDDEPGSTNAKIDEADLTIEVTDVNDHKPMFTPSIYVKDIVETAASGATLVTFVVRDEDEGTNSETSISIVSGDVDNIFTIDANHLVLSGKLDFESRQVYNLIVEVSDSGTPELKSSGSVTINVLPANEESPLMDTNTFNKTISEATPVGTLVYTAAATDGDGGTDGVITYSIESGVPNQEFILDSETGNLFVGSELDFDTAPNKYTIVIKATDGAGRSDANSTVTLTIILSDTNDHIPQFPSSILTFQLDEELPPNSVVGRISATDDDSGANQQILYKKVGGGGMDYFNLNADTGIITTSDRTINFESTQILYLTVTAEDRGTPSLTSSVVVKFLILNKNDNPPSIIPSEFAVTISEDSAAGTSVQQFRASDLDSAIDSYSLVEASDDFELNPSTGLLTVKRALDRETVASYIVKVAVTDMPVTGDTTKRTATGTLTVYIGDINDNTPVITGTYSITLREDTPINTVVFEIDATDPDADDNGNLVYTIESGNVGSVFTIDSAGIILVDKPLDYETTTSYSLVIVVSDQGDPAKSSQVTATVTVTDYNDNDPIFGQASYIFSVLENAAINTIVGNISASDNDANVVLTYSFDTFTQGSQADFSIDGSTGQIKVASRIDREQVAVYRARVKVADNGAVTRSAFVIVVISVTDVNDNPPVFQALRYTAVVRENEPPSTLVVNVLATDVDFGFNSEITYSIDETRLDGSNAAVFFSINSTTGLIETKTSLDHETNPIVTFIVIAKDSGTPALSASATVVVTVIDVNENRPVFRFPFYNAEVAYNGQCSRDIVTVEATDADTGENGRVVYSLQAGGADNSFFTLDTSTGLISSRTGDVLTIGRRYTLTVNAVDNGAPPLSAAQPAIVRIDAFNPADRVIIIRLTITKIEFQARRSKFMTNFQNALRRTEPRAVIRIWCVNEYKGQAFTPGTQNRRRKRRQAIDGDPVEVSLYALSDEVTENQVNLGQVKNYINQSELYTSVAANDIGDPGTTITGSDFEDFNIVNVAPYIVGTTTPAPTTTTTTTEKPERFEETTAGKIIIGVVCTIGIVLLIILATCLFLLCRNSKKNESSRSRNSRRYNDDEPERDYDIYGKYAGYIQDTEAGYPYGKAFPPIVSRRY